MRRAREKAVLPRATMETVTFSMSTLKGLYVLNKNDRFPINYAHVCQFTNKIDDN